MIVKDFCFASASGLCDIHARSMTPDEGEPKAVVQITHGMAEHKERYMWLAERLTEAIRRDWADFIVTSSRRGATVPTPPGLGGARRSRDEIMAIADSRERQRAIAENHELFGF